MDNRVFINVSLSKCIDMCDPKPVFVFLLEVLKKKKPTMFHFSEILFCTCCSRHFERYRPYVRAAQSFFEINEYFIRMNNKSFFFFYWLMSELIFLPARAFSELSITL